MKTDLESLSDDWDALKATEPVKQPIVGTTSLAEDWRDLRAQPNYLYYVIGGYGLDGMALYRMRCHGESIRGRMPGQRKDVPIWIVDFDRRLWAGKDFDPSKHEVVQRKDGTLVTRFHIPKVQIHENLSTAILAFRSKQEEYRARALEDVKRAEADIVERLKWIAQAQRKADDNSFLPFEVEDIVREDAVRTRST